MYYKGIKGNRSVISFFLAWVTAQWHEYNCGWEMLVWQTTCPPCCQGFSKFTVRKFVVSSSRFCLKWRRNLDPLITLNQHTFNQLKFSPSRSLLRSVIESSSGYVHKRCLKPSFFTRKGGCLRSLSFDNINPALWRVNKFFFLTHCFHNAKFTVIR